MPAARAPSRLVAGLTPVALAIAVGLTAAASILLTRETGRVAAIWPVNALILVVLLKSPRSHWLGLLAAAAVGNVAANLLTGDALRLALLLSAGNLVEVLVAAWLMTRGGGVRLMRRSGLQRFVLAGVIACMASTFVAFLTLRMVGSHLAPEGALLWFSADLLGLAIFAPIMLAAAEGGLHRALGFGTRRREVMLQGVLIVVTLAVFLQSNYPLLFIPPALMVLIAFQTGFGGATLGVLIISVIAIAATLVGRGPLVLFNGDLSARVIVLQLFLATLATIALIVGAAVAERRSLLGRLTAARARARSRSLRERVMIQHAGLAERMSQVGYWTLDVETGAVYWSPEVYRIHGVEPGDFDPSLGDAMAFYEDGDRERVAALIARGVETGEPWEFDAVLIRRSDGDRREVRSMASSQRDAAGRVVQFFGVFKDLTDERRMVAAVLEQQKLYRLLADNATDVIATYRLDGTFTYLSPSIFELLGYTPEELVGRKTYDIIHPDDRQSAQDQFRRAGGKDAAFSVEYRALTKSGEVRWLEARPRFHRDEAGALLEVTDSVRDVTERRTREAALADAQAAAEAAARAKADFLANMSHEIRTPLNGVLGFAEVLAKTDLDSDQTRYVERIRTAGRGLSVLIDDILDFSKIEAGKMIVERRPFELAALIGDVVALVEAGNAKRLALTVEITGEAGPWVLGDQQRVRQVLLNLLGNAVKFTDLGSVHVHADIAPAGIVIAVRDTGVGIAPEALEHLFEGFTQADATISRKFGGTGLGLTISRSLAQLMGGDLTLTSRIGEGTTATLTLPYAAVIGDTGARPAAQALGGGGQGFSPLRIMVVDDVDMNRELLELSLAPEGHRVSSFESAASAIAALKDGQAFDLILMDVQMPGMDGLEATRIIRALGGEAARTPVVAFTANVLPEQIAAFRAAGMDDHIGKPVDLAALRSIIERVGARAGKRGAAASAEDDPLEGLRSRYRSHLAGFAVQFREMLRVADPAESARGIAALAHSIAGTSGSLGFAQVSDAAFELEAVAMRCLKEGGGCDAVERAVQMLLAAIPTAQEAA